MNMFDDLYLWSAVLCLLGGAALTFLAARRKPKVDLRRKVIFITGCDSGFGFSLAHHCAELEMLVVAGCFLMGEGADQLRKIPNITVVRVDVTDEESLKKATEEVEEITARNESVLHCVVNNAAAGVVFAEAGWQTNKQIRNQFLVNSVGPILVTRYLLPLLSQAGGRVINVVSFCTECPLPYLAVYSASKAALMSVTDGMRPEVAKYGVDMVLVNPGDHPAKTPLCHGQMQNYEQIQLQLEKDGLSLYGDYVSRCRTKFTTMFPPPALSRLADPGFYTTMTAAMEDASPATMYVNSDMGTKMFFGMIKKLPRRWGDWIRIKIMRLPQYKME